MRNFLIIAICSVLAWVASQPLHAQYTDTEFWLGSGVSQSINKDLSWSLQWENRWTQGMRWHDQGLVDAALEYDLNKHWSLNAQWRFSERQLAEGGYATRRRGALRLLGDWKAGWRQSQGPFDVDRELESTAGMGGYTNPYVGTNDENALGICSRACVADSGGSELGIVLPRRWPMERTTSGVCFVGCIQILGRGRIVYVWKYMEG